MKHIKYEQIEPGICLTPCPNLVGTGYGKVMVHSAACENCQFYRGNYDGHVKCVADED